MILDMLQDQSPELVRIAGTNALKKRAGAVVCAAIWRAKTYLSG